MHSIGSGSVVFCRSLFVLLVMVSSVLRFGGNRGRDRMIIGFITTYAISAYDHQSCEFESRSWPSVLDTTLCDKVCQWLATCQWFSPGNPVSATNKTDRHDITEILLNVALNNITPFFYLRLWLPLRYLQTFDHSAFCLHIIWLSCCRNHTGILMNIGLAH